MFKVEPSNDFKPKKGDFVKLVSKDDGKTFYKQEIVKSLNRVGRHHV
jgi:hypothetical protein